jgi:hypothetical protein
MVHFYAYLPQIGTKRLIKFSAEILILLKNLLLSMGNVFLYFMLLRINMQLY